MAITQDRAYMINHLLITIAFIPWSKAQGYVFFTLIRWLLSYNYAANLS